MLRKFIMLCILRKTEMLIFLFQDTSKLKTWKILNVCRNIGAIVGWILIALFPAEDMLHVHLCNMMKYQPITTHAAPTRY